jgi:hypothetical protein
MPERQTQAERLLPQRARGALHRAHNGLYGRFVPGMAFKLTLVFFGPRTPNCTLCRLLRLLRHFVSLLDSQRAHSKTGWPSSCSISSDTSWPASTSVWQALAGAFLQRGKLFDQMDLVVGKRTGRGAAGEQVQKLYLFVFEPMSPHHEAMLRSCHDALKTSAAICCNMLMTDLPRLCSPVRRSS